MNNAIVARTEASTPELLFELARGGMGTVHLARIAGIGGFERFVVVKRILNDPNNSDEEAFERFLTEARVAARIHHANVVGTHHVGTDEQGLYIVLDYIEGGSLAVLANRVALRGGTIPIPLILRIALDALAGLGAVHRATGKDGASLGLVHRDVSLQNILVGRDGIARLTDFGIAKSMRSAVKTKTGSLVGKLLYLPPEYIRQEPIDVTADIYMLGVTLWCALTCEEPWEANDVAQLLHRILTDPVPSIASRRKEPVAPEIEALVRKACDPDPRERFQSADQMMIAIERLGRERGWVASQHEVAAFVEGLLGVDLDRRRERIAQIVVGNEGADVSNEPTTVRALPGRQASPGSEVSAIFPSSRRGGSRAKKVLFWGLSAVVLAVAGVFLDLSHATVRTPATQREDPTYTMKGKKVNALPDPQLALSVVPPLPVASASTATLVRDSPPVQARRHGQGPVRLPLASPAKPPPSSDEISTRNPYR